MDKITTDDEFERWLKDQNDQVHFVIGSRAALRVFPAVLGAMADPTAKIGVREQLALLTARAIITSAVAGTVPTADVDVSAALSAADFAASSAASPAAQFAAVSAARSAASSAARSAAYSDAIFIGGNTGKNRVLQIGIWGDQSIMPSIAEQWHLFLESDVGGQPSWAFWREWYQGFLDGKPMDWALQRRVALIADADWEQGPAHIAGVIAEIRARFDLENRIAELDTALVKATQSRHGIGGNFPPERVSTEASVAKELLVVWEP